MEAIDLPNWEALMETMWFREQVLRKHNSST